MWTCWILKVKALKDVMLFLLDNECFSRMRQTKHWIYFTSISAAEINLKITRWKFRQRTMTVLKVIQSGLVSSNNEPSQRRNCRRQYSTRNEDPTNEVVGRTSSTLEIPLEESSERPWRHRLQRLWRLRGLRYILLAATLRKGSVSWTRRTQTV